RDGINIYQSHVQLAGLKRQVISEVGDRLRDRVQALVPQRSRLVPFRRAVQEEERRYAAGEGQVDDVVRARTDLQEAELVYFYAPARYGRNLLLLNTAVGARIFP